MALINHYRVRAAYTLHVELVYHLSRFVHLQTTLELWLVVLLGFKLLGLCSVPKVTSCWISLQYLWRALWTFSGLFGGVEVLDVGDFDSSAPPHCTRGVSNNVQVAVFIFLSAHQSVHLCVSASCCSLDTHTHTHTCLFVFMLIYNMCISVYVAQLLAARLLASRCLFV